MLQKESTRRPALNISGHILDVDILGIIQAMTFALAKEKPGYFFTSIIFAEKSEENKHDRSIDFDAFIRSKTESSILATGSVHVTKMFYDPFNSVLFYRLDG